MRKKHIAILMFVGWLSIVNFLMGVYQDVNPGIYITLLVIGLLASIDYLNPSFYRPDGMNYLRILEISGILIFIVMLIYLNISLLR